LAYGNFIELRYSTPEGTVIFQCSINLCRLSFFTYKPEHSHPPTKSCSPSTAATGTQHSVVPHHRCNGILAIRNVRWTQQHCPSKSGDGFYNAYTCIWPCVVKKKQHFRHFCCGTNSTFRILCISLVWSQFTVIPPGKKFTRTTPFLCQNTVTMIFPANSTLLTSSLGHHLVQFHDCRLDSG